MLSRFFGFGRRQPSAKKRKIGKKSTANRFKLDPEKQKQNKKQHWMNGNNGSLVDDNHSFYSHRLITHRHQIKILQNRFWKIFFSLWVDVITTYKTYICTSFQKNCTWAFLLEKHRETNNLMMMIIIREDYKKKNPNELLRTSI